MADPGVTAACLARYYDLDLEDDPGDLDLYRAMAERTGGPILELAAGSGRLAVPLARSGYAVTAVDNDPAMLLRAEQAWAATRRPAGRRGAGSLELVDADLTTLALDGRYGLAFIGLNSLMLLDLDAQRQALRVLATHLRPDGVGIIDMVVMDATDLAGYDGRLYLDWIRDDPETGGTVTKLSSARHDAATATVVVTTMFDATSPGGGAIERTVRIDRLHLRSAADLVRDALDAGLRTELLAGDHQGSPFGPGAERVVLIAVPV